MKVFASSPKHFYNSKQYSHSRHCTGERNIYCHIKSSREIRSKNGIYCLLAFPRYILTNFDHRVADSSVFLSLPSRMSFLASSAIPFKDDRIIPTPPTYTQHPLDPETLRPARWRLSFHAFARFRRAIRKASDKALYPQCQGLSLLDFWTSRRFMDPLTEFEQFDRLRK